MNCRYVLPFFLAISHPLPLQVSQDRAYLFLALFRTLTRCPQKCDGVKPVCGPCKLHPREDECEYADGPGRSRTKVLEDTVSRLEARLLELENPEATTPSVLLHDPYRAYSQRLSTSPPVHIPEASLVFGQLSPFSPTSTTSSLPSGRHWQSFSALEANTESTGSSGSSTSPIRLPVSMPFAGYEVRVLFSTPARHHIHTLLQEPPLLAFQTS